jgi:hypothetical protein
MESATELHKEILSLHKVDNMELKEPKLWSITVNTNDPSDLKKYITKLQKKRKDLLRSLGYNGIHFQGSKYHADAVLPLIEKILATDLSALYKDCETSEKYYVYVHCDPDKPLRVQHELKHLVLASRFNLTHEPFYVGKGTGNRCEDLNRNEGHRKILAKLVKIGKPVIINKIAENLTEGESLSLEAKLIDILGIRQLGKEGYLVNLDEGKHSGARRETYGKEVFPILRRNGFLV